LLPLQRETLAAMADDRPLFEPCSEGCTTFYCISRGEKPRLTARARRRQAGTRMTTSKRKPPATRKDPPAPDATADLRRQAEEHLDGLSADTVASSAATPLPEEITAAVHELRVHQIELEMQNEELRRAHLELDAQREKYFELFDRAPVGYLTLSEKSIVGDANLTAAHLLGIARRQLVGQPFSAFVLAADRDAYYRHQRTLQKTEAPQTHELRLQRLGGGAGGGDADAAPGHFWAHLESRPRREAGGEPLSSWVAFTDVSERKQAEEDIRRLNDVLDEQVLAHTAELAESEARLRSLFETMAEGVVLFAGDGEIISANLAAESILGLTRSEEQDRTYDRPHWELRRPDGTPLPAEEMPGMRVTREKRAMKDVVTGFAQPNGAVSWISINAAPLLDGAGALEGVVAVFTDMTERKQAEDALRRRERELSTLVENAPDMIVRFDTDLRHVYCNTAVEQQLGVPALTLIGKTPLETGEPREQAELACRSLRQVLDTGEELAVEQSYPTPFGQRHLATRIVPERDAQGSIESLLAITRDITARKRTEQLLSVPAEILAIIAAPAPVRETAEGIVAALKKATGFDAVGLRLQDGDDYPFVSAVGYSEEFLEAENALAVRYPEGGLCRDEDGTVSLECTCGLVLRGDVDPASSLFTAGGSAWTNDALPLLELPPEEDPRLHPRNRCIHVGFRSFALVPLRAGEQILGLLHLADRRTDRFTAESMRFFEGLGASIGVALLGKRAEEALQGSEERLQLVLRGSNDAPWDWNLESDDLYCSPRWWAMLGYEVDELPADADLWGSLTHPADQSLVDQVLGDALETGPDAYETELRLRHKDGHYVPVLSRGLVLRDAEGKPVRVSGTNTDLTVRKQAEEELRASKEDYRFLAESIKDVVWVVDAETMCYRYMSPAVEGLGGRTAEELLNLPLIQTFTADVGAHVIDLTRRRARDFLAGKEPSGRFYTDEVGQPRKDGSTVWTEVITGYHINPKSGGVEVRGVSRDITERKQTEEELARALSLLESTMESTADGILVANSIGEIVRFNHKFREMWGLPEAIVAAKDDAAALSFVSGQLKEPQTFLTTMRDVIGAPDVISFDVLELRDGRVLERYSQPQRIGDALVGRVWSFRDITERKRAEEEIQQRNQELARLNEELVDEAAALAEANAATDDLTGLANRRHFYESLEKAVSLARRHGSPLSLVSFDLDGLKRVNDSSGHEAGDEALASFAALLIDLCRAEDLPGRLGGDEFSVLLPGIELSGGGGLAERVREAVRSCAALAERGVTVSGGIVQWSPGELPDDLLRRADQALYAAKRVGGDAVAIDG